MPAQAYQAPVVSAAAAPVVRVAPFAAVAAVQPVGLRVRPVVAVAAPVVRCVRLVAAVVGPVAQRVQLDVAVVALVERHVQLDVAVVGPAFRCCAVFLPAELSEQLGPCHVVPHERVDHHAQPVRFHVHDQPGAAQRVALQPLAAHHVLAAHPAP